MVCESLAPPEWDVDSNITRVAKQIVAYEGGGAGRGFASVLPITSTKRRTEIGMHALFVKCWLELY